MAKSSISSLSAPGAIMSGWPAPCPNWSRTVRASAPKLAQDGRDDLRADGFFDEEGQFLKRP